MNSIHVPSLPHLVTVPPLQLLMLDGAGAPDNFKDYAATLRTAAELFKMEPGPLEALWWTADGSPQIGENTDLWRWTVMLMLPGNVTDTQLAEARGNRNILPLAKKMQLAMYEEGRVVERLYTGSLRDKAPELQEMDEFARFQGYTPHGKYHEIYLDDPGPETPADAKTILRLPVSR